jgi:hypothetical protein
MVVIRMGGEARPLKPGGTLTTQLSTLARSSFWSARSVPHLVLLEEDGHGVHYAVSLYDTPENRELALELKTGLNGSSYRLQVIRDVFVGYASHHRNLEDSLRRRSPRRG